MRPYLNSLLTRLGLGGPTWSSNDSVAYNTLAIKLLSHELDSHLSTSSASVFVAPCTVASVLSLLRSACTVGSLSEEQLTAATSPCFARVSDLLHMRGTAGADIRVAHALFHSTEAWVDEELARHAEDVGAAISPMPKSGADGINAWVKKATNGAVEKVVEHAGEDAHALVVSAVSFKAPWMKTFGEDRTETAEFLSRSGERREVPFMHKCAEKINFAQMEIGGLEGEGEKKKTVQIVEIPYAGKDFTAVVVLPEEGLCISDVVRRLNGKLWGEWMGALKETKMDDLGMPRFEVECRSSVIDGLRGIGVHAPFDGETEGAFNRLTKDKEARVTQFTSLVKVKCTEEGTTASAASAAVIGRAAPDFVGPSVILNRPFLFAVTSKEHSLLFAGVVDNPQDPLQ